MWDRLDRHERDLGKDVERLSLASDVPLVFLLHMTTEEKAGLGSASIARLHASCPDYMYESGKCCYGTWTSTIHVCQPELL